MNLKKTIQRFNTETFTDTYGIGTSFKGKVSVFNEVTNSGVASRRRILETLPDVTLPSSQTIQSNGDNFIVGYGNKDVWRSEVLRIKYPILPVGTASRQASIAQVITNTVPTTLYYGHPSFVSDIKMELQESDLQTAFAFFFPSNTTVQRGSIIIQGSNYYKVRGIPFVDNAGFLTTDVILLDSPVQTLTFSSDGGYDPVTDTIAVASTQSLTAFVEEAYLSYDNTSERFQVIKPGDKAITIKPTVTPKAGDDIGDFKILSIDVVDTAYYCHCRRA